MTQHILQFIAGDYYNNDHGQTCRKVVGANVNSSTFRDSVRFGLDAAGMGMYMNHDGGLVFLTSNMDSIPEDFVDAFKLRKDTDDPGAPYYAYIRPHGMIEDAPNRIDWFDLMMIVAKRGNNGITFWEIMTEEVFVDGTYAVPH